MKHKFEVGEEVYWYPMPGWKAEATIRKKTHIFWLVPAYRVWVCKSQVSDWSKMDCIWTVPEGALKKKC